LCPVVWAWLLLGEAITSTQAIGGTVVLIGLALAGRSSDHRTAESTWPGQRRCTRHGNRISDLPRVSWK